MKHQELEKRIAGLSDVALVRLLTRDADGQPPEVLAAAEGEAKRRDLPIDEAFIPDTADEDGAPETGAVRLEAGGKAITCGHCGHDRFDTREVLLNTRGLTFFNLDWLNQSATAVICAACGLVQLYATPPEAAD